ncbi:hypothetical protein GF412_01880 [Candidatus Micrarchaeota archaeon]|nr:hypothetical protein [Candidatus Micrarchaeota archaeon]MBD3417711.1 hypothetical protein [Candidatus Micrarchaeota archaeon]
MKKIAIFLFCLPLLFASASIVDASNVTTNVESSAAFKVYVDTFGNNPDFALELCNEGQKYIAAAYTANVSGTWIMVPISKNLTSGSTNTMVYTSIGTGPCYYTPVDSFAFSQFKDSTRTPPVFVSAFPGRIHALISDNSDGTGSPDLVPVDYADGWLEGSYSVSRSFSQATGLVNANVNSITFQTELGSITRGPGAADWGLNSTTGRSMLIALCDDDFGNECDDAVIANDSSDLPVGLSLVGTVDDQHVHNRYVVVDGLGDPICIGANLRTTVSPSPGSIPYGGSSNVTITITNAGNVNVTTDFVLQFNVSGSGYSDTVNYPITEDLASGGGSTTRNYIFNATGLAGNVNLRGYADSTNQIAECSKADNLGTATISISPVWYLHVWIDGNYTNVFPEWGRPYNVTFYINNSNGDEVPNARYEITETNGLNPFAPIQTWTDGATPRGLSSESKGTATGNSSGYVTVTLIPTCNKFYSPGSPVNLTPNVGDYSVIVNGYHSGGSNPIDFAYNGSEIEDYPLLVPNKTCVGPGWTNDKDVINKNTYIFDIYDWMYEVYSITKKLVDPT